MSTAEKEAERYYRAVGRSTKFKHYVGPLAGIIVVCSIASGIYHIVFNSASTGFMVLGAMLVFTWVVNFIESMLDSSTANALASAVSEYETNA